RARRHPAGPDRDPPGDQDRRRPRGRPGAHVNAPVVAPPLGDPDRARLDAVRRLPESAARKAAAVELQVMFLTELLSAMRKTAPEGAFRPRPSPGSIDEGTFDRAAAQAIAARAPLGLVARLGEGLKERDGPADK